MEHYLLLSPLFTSLIRPKPPSQVEVRVDNTLGFQALKNDVPLGKLNIILDFGHIHILNKNPVVVKGI